MLHSDQAEEFVCPSCCEASSGDRDFCERCGAPVGRFTTLDPMKAIDAQGWLFRKSARARIGPMVLMGMWALFGIPLAGLIVSLLAGPHAMRSIPALSSLGICLIYLLILVRVTGNYARNRPGPGPYDPGRK